METKKINIRDIPNWINHNGWAKSVNALSPLSHPQGIYFNVCLEDTFFWQNPREAYPFPWIGMIHHPPRVPQWRFPNVTLQTLFNNRLFIDSLTNCIGIFTLSEYTSDYVRNNLKLPVSTLLHPVSPATQPFQFERFKANPDKKIIQLGYFLRKVSAIYRLPLSQDNPLKLSKVALMPNVHLTAFSEYRRYVMEEIVRSNQMIDSSYLANTHEVHHIDRAAYEAWLSENIGFIEMYDASANNAVLECIAAATPLLVNPLPAVKEYLGADYPLYYDSLEQAAAMACDENLLHQAHLYLKNSPIREKITFDYFLESFKRSEVYQRI